MRLDPKMLTILVMGAFFLGVLLLASLIKYEQDPRSKAVQSTTLSFTPATTSSSPYGVSVSNPVDVGVSLDPGNNLVSVVTMTIDFDGSKITPAEPFFTSNADAFPLILEGPAVIGNQVIVSVSIGGDIIKAISTPTSVGTFHFRAIAPTGSKRSSTQISFNTKTAAYSVATSDPATENVIANTVPFYLQIKNVKGGGKPPRN